MSPALADFLFEVANFLLLTAALGWLLFRPVRRVLDRERERHTREVEEGRELRAEAESLLAEARVAREDAERETTARRSEILAAAERQADELLDQARARRTEERRAVEKELETVRGAQADALAETVGRIAAASVARLLGVFDGPSLDRALVRAACQELEAAPSGDRGSAPGSAPGSAVVESAAPLGDEERRLLERLLGEGFEERTVPELGAGVRVTTAAGQVDATARSFAREAARQVVAAGGPEAEEGGLG